MSSVAEKNTFSKPVPGVASPDRRKHSRMLDAEVGQAIRWYRKNAKMTLQGLADRLGIAYQQVQKYETGVNRVGAGRLMEIAEILNVPVASLFEASHMRGNDAALHGDVTADGRLLMAAFSRIADPQKRANALAYVRSLSASAMS